MYNKKVMDYLRSRGHEVHLHVFDKNICTPGSYILNLRKKINPGSVCLIDSLLLYMIKDEVRALRQDMYLIGMMHLSQSIDLENINALNNPVLKDEIEAMNTCHMIIASSFFLKKFYDNQGMNKTPVHAIPPGVDVYQVKKKYNTIPMKIINVGNILPAKGLHLLIDALSRLKTVFQLEIIGDITVNSDYYKLLMEKIIANKLETSVHFNGIQDFKVINNRLVEADFFVFPSLYETFGMALAEAIKVGLPVICSKLPALEEHVKEEIALFFEPGNMNDLTGKLDRITRERALYPELVKEIKSCQFPYKTWKETGQDFYATIINAYRDKWK